MTEQIFTQEKYDRVVYDILIDLWEAYRLATTTQDAKPFNEVFEKLYSQHRDEEFIHVIEYMGLALAPSVNRAVQRVENFNVR